VRGPPRMRPISNRGEEPDSQEGDLDWPTEYVGQEEQGFSQGK
jgi:hypothetical protein